MQAAAAPPLFAPLALTRLAAAQAAKTQQKSKEAKMAAAMAGGKSKKKKWSQGKVREKVANKVLFDDETYTRFLAEIPKARRAVGPRIRNPLAVDGRDQRAPGRAACPCAREYGEIGHKPLITHVHATTVSTHR